MTRSLRPRPRRLTLLAIGVVSIAAVAAAATLTGPGRAASAAVPNNTVPADDLRHRRGRQDADGGEGDMDGYRPDHLHLPVAPL